jgi:hypothetical protein
MSPIRLIRQIVTKIAEKAGITEFSPQFLISEWEHVIDAWRLASLEDYTGVPHGAKESARGSPT